MQQSDSILTRVEAILFARPLKYLYDELGEEPLTPDRLIFERKFSSFVDGLFDGKLLIIFPVINDFHM